MFRRIRYAITTLAMAMAFTQLGGVAGAVPTFGPCPGGANGFFNAYNPFNGHFAAIHCTIGTSPGENLNHIVMDAHFYGSSGASCTYQCSQGAGEAWFNPAYDRVYFSEFNGRFHVNFSRWNAGIPGQFPSYNFPGAVNNGWARASGGQPYWVQNYINTASLGGGGPLNYYVAGTSLSTSNGVGTVPTQQSVAGYAEHRRFGLNSGPATDAQWYTQWHDSNLGYDYRYSEFYLWGA